MKNKKLTVLSLFNGMNTGRVALENVGIEIEKYYSSEIKPYAIELTQYHHPDTIQLGDVTKWEEWDIEWKEIDMVLSGSPCQDLSIAGKRKGLKGERSSLFFTFVDILNHIKKLNPNVLFLQENVGSAPKLDVGIMSRALGVYPVRINSNLLTAQNRDRYYWTNIRTKQDGMFGDLVSDIPQPKDKGILLKDILEETDIENNDDFDLLIKDKNNKIIAIKEATVRGYADTQENDGLDLAFPKSKTRRGRVMREKSNCLLEANNPYYVNKGTYLRLFTQTELERLQGFTDGWTSILSYRQASSLLGDGWTLPVIEHIFSFIEVPKLST